jgi:hypothetical protein
MTGLAGLKFGHRLVKMLDQRAVLVRHGPADRVRDVDRRRARRHHRPADLHQKVRLGARGVLGRKLHVLTNDLARLTPSTASRRISSRALFNLNSR